jgi:hypothetical protein
MFPKGVPNHTFIDKVCPIKFSPSLLYGLAKGEALNFSCKSSYCGELPKFQFTFYFILVLGTGAIKMAHCKRKK